MALNIIDLIKGQLGPALVSQASTQLGESESGISKAISGLLPAVLGGMANHSNDSAVIDSITGASSSGILGNLLSGSTNNSLVSTVLNSIFGNNLAGIVNSISTFSGVSNTSANSLLNMVTGATLGSVGKYATDNNLGSSGISNLLNEQKGLVSSLLPAGLSLASLGVDGHDTTMAGADKVTATSFDQPKVEVNRGGETHVTSTPETTTDGNSIWKWLLPLLLLLLAGWFLWKQCDKQPADQTTAMTDSTMIQNDTMNTMTNDSTMTGNGTMTDIDLNGTILKGYSNGMEESMIKFLTANSYTDAADDASLKDTWYDFDNVTFKMGSPNELLPGSQAQLDNLVKILKAYPDTKIKIGGYADNTGDKAINEELSQKRADFLKAELSKLGVGAQVTGAAGFGSEFADVPASATDAQRATDRNMAVRFTK